MRFYTFWLATVTLICHLLLVDGTASNHGSDITLGGKVQNIPMKTEHGMQLLQHWVDTMLGSFIATFADRRVLKAKPRHVIEEFGECNKKATGVPMQARCLSLLLKDQISGKKYLKKTVSAQSSLRLQKYEKRKQIGKNKKKAKANGWIGGFRTKRENKANDVTRRNDYELISPGLGKMTPFGKLAHVMLKAVLAAKNKTHAQPWQETIQLMHDRALRRKEAQKRLEEESLENMDQFIFRGMRDRGIAREDLGTVFNDPKKLKQWLSKRRASKHKEPAEKLIGLLRQGLKIGYSLSGKNSSSFDDKTLKIASPRFLSVVPEEEESKNETVEFFSPSLFSLHDKGKGTEKLMSLPNLMKGLSGQDHQKWMDFIMEAAGVVDEVDKLDTDMKDPKTTEDLRKRYEIESRSKDGTPLYFTRDNVTKMFGSIEDRKIDAYLSLTNSLSKEQVKELNHTGYVMMTPKQLHMIYGPKSPYNNSEALARLSKFRNVSHMEEHLIKDIHRTAELQSFKLRHKDQVLKPISFSPVILNGAAVSTPIVLSPIIFSPLILSPALLGPLILSPTIFTPVILSPRTFSPIILSPLAFVPFVLSPVTFHPLILSPGVFVPIILTPVTLSPLILSPQVFSPFVLSPLLLSPLILNPNVGSPLVLSPFVLSPIIWSPQALGALVLSPYALSPVIQSKLIAYSVVLSPSWLNNCEDVSITDTESVSDALPVESIVEFLFNHKNNCAPKLQMHARTFFDCAALIKAVKERFMASTISCKFILTASATWGPHVDGKVFKILNEELEQYLHLNRIHGGFELHTP